jgi:hypothetical protein
VEGDPVNTNVWDYKARKSERPCVICGGEANCVGMALPLCNADEVEWLASEERAVRATARIRFVNRMRAARKMEPISK